MAMSAKRFCLKVKDQLGVSENPMGSNRQKYGAAYGMNGVAWCAIFVWWCFTSSGLKCPFGKTAYVPTCASRMSGLHKGGAGQARPGDVRITAGNRHVGICVSSGGGVIAGNSSDRVSREGAGGTYYRPKCFGPDIIPIKFNNKTYYYNPETKKVCTDKQGKNPLPPSTVSNTGGYSGSTGNSRGGSGSGSKAKTIITPYKEYYVTPPSNFEDAKDVIKTSQNIELEETVRLKTLKQDINKILKLYPNNSQLTNLLQSISKNYDFNAKTLYKKYEILIKVLTDKLISFIEGQSLYCFAITGTSKEDLRYCYKTLYSERDLNNKELYFKYLGDEWMELFNEMTLKRDSIKYFLDVQQDFKSPLLSSDYLNNRQKEMTQAYDTQLSGLYTQMEKYKKEKIDSFNGSDVLNEINQQIENTTIQINQKEQFLLKNYSEDSKTKKELELFENLLDNLKNKKEEIYYNYFSSDYQFWNKDIVQNPSHLNFWLDFLSTKDQEFDKYNVKNIGLRSFVAVDSNVSSVYTREIPQVIFYSDKDIKKTKTGFNYLYIQNIEDLFINSSQGISAKDIIDDALYQHSYCCEETNLTTIPIHYLQPNTRILLYNENSKVNNEYIIYKITKSLVYNGTMNIVASKAVNRLY